MSDHMREQFEDMMSSQGEWPQAIEKDARGGYKFATAATAWETWQSAWEAGQEMMKSRVKDLEAINLGLTKALRHVCELHCVDDYYSGKLRDKEIDRAVNSALESVMPTCKRDKKPCGKAGGYCLECPSGPKREWLSK